MNSDIRTTLVLVNKAKTGDDQALNLLLERYTNRILRIVRMRLGAKLRARMQSMDVVQEVMTRVIKDLDNFEPVNESAFLHWVSKLVQNEIRDQADFHSAKKRDLNKEEHRQKDDDRCSVTASIPAKSLYRPSFQLVLKEDVLKLEAVMDKLSEMQREVIILKQYEEMTFKEIGSKLNCSEDAARMQYTRAIDKLTDLMTNE